MELIGKPPATPIIHCACPPTPEHPAPIQDERDGVRLHCSFLSFAPLSFSSTPQPLPCLPSRGLLPLSSSPVPPHPLGWFQSFLPSVSFLSPSVPSITWGIPGTSQEWASQTPQSIQSTPGILGSRLSLIKRSRLPLGRYYYLLIQRVRRQKFGELDQVAEVSKSSTSQMPICTQIPFVKCCFRFNTWR